MKQLGSKCRSSQKTGWYEYGGWCDLSADAFRFLFIIVLSLSHVWPRIYRPKRMRVREGVLPRTKHLQVIILVFDAVAQNPAANLKKLALTSIPDPI